MRAVLLGCTPTYTPNVVVLPRGLARRCASQALPALLLPKRFNDLPKQPKLKEI
jgi:hypothetical protein